MGRPNRGSDNSRAPRDARDRVVLLMDSPAIKPEDIARTLVLEGRLPFHALYFLECSALVGGALGQRGRRSGRLTRRARLRSSGSKSVCSGVPERQAATTRCCLLSVLPRERVLARSRC